MPTRSTLKIILAVLFVVTCWGYSPTGIRIALHAYDPTHLALARFVIASLLMAVIALCQGISLPRLRDLPLLGLLGFFAVCLHHLALNFGQRGISAGAASVLAQSTPLFSALLAHWVLRERVSLWRWGCVWVGLVGAALVVMADKGLGNLDPHGLLILLAALSWSVYFALQKHHSHRYSGLTLVCYTVWSGTLLLGVFWPGLTDQVLKAPAPAQWAVVLLGVFPSALAYLAWAYVLRHVEISRASMALYLTPLAAMVIAAAMLGERPALLVLVGALVVLCSVLAMNLEHTRKVPRRLLWERARSR